MERLKITLENCYGIKKLTHEFNFKSHNSFIIYASNGSMKTSFTKTFEDFSNKKEPTDEVFPLRNTTIEIKDENGKEIKRDKVFVIASYADEYKTTSIETLLINKEMKNKYDKIFYTINDKKAALLSKLAELSGIEKEKIEEMISQDMIQINRTSSFIKAIESIADELSVKESENSELKYNTYKYGEIFTPYSNDLLKSEDFQSKLEAYISIYDELINGSNFFKNSNNSIFDHNNASDLAKNLKKNNFLKVGHKLSLLLNESQQNNEWTDVTSDKGLEELITREKSKILNNKDLIQKYDQINSMLTKNGEAKKFADYIKLNRPLLNELSNIKLFKHNLWMSYLLQNKDLCNEVIKLHKDNMDELNTIKKQISKESTKWHKVIDKFNQRFHVPFLIEIEKKEDKILGLSKVESFKFSFKDKDTSEQKELEEKKLKKLLSQGEKRALYLLNVIFDIETRKELRQETLFIIDDIADSFDYQNKYAIIEYLKEISEQNKNIFYQIILTHNYDFYRIISKQLQHIPHCGDIRPHILEAIRDECGITLKSTKYQNNPFDHWSNNLHEDEMLIASIPFIRNLAEYSRGENDDNYKRLTSFLHIKSDTAVLTVEKLCDTIHSITPIFNIKKVNNKERLVETMIYRVADKILATNIESLELESKIVLSIAIRLKAEKFMFSAIKKEQQIQEIKKNQTIELIKIYNKLSTKKECVTNLLDRICLMTPANIHLNSFMYEPILDMSNRNLKGIYKEVTALLNTAS